MKTERARYYKSITKSADELLHLLSGNDADNFTLKVLLSDGQWTVELSTMEPPARGIGQGQSFAEAWNAIKPWWSKP
jgi:hypothetical protein